MQIINVIQIIWLLWRINSKFCLAYNDIEATTGIYDKSASDVAKERRNFTNALLEYILSQADATNNFLIAPQVLYELKEQLNQATDDDSYEDDDSSEQYTNFSISNMTSIAITNTLHTNLQNKPRRLADIQRKYEHLNLLTLNASQSVDSNQTDVPVIDLLNKATFKSRWSFNFQRRDTHKHHFYNATGDPVYMDAMRKDDVFSYAILSHLNATALQLPLQQIHMKMLILLPDKADGLQQLLAFLSVNTSQLLQEIIEKQLKSTLVRLIMPKFHILHKVNLTELPLHLKTDFTHITHAALIEVNEHGMGSLRDSIVLFWNTYSSSRAYDTFDISHPFLFVIYNEQGIHFFGYLAKL